MLFQDNMASTTTGAPGTGSFTPSAAASGYRSLTLLAANQHVHYRIEEGTAWEIGVGFYNGTNVSRGLMYSSTGSPVTFTAAAVLYVIAPATRVQPHLGTGNSSIYTPSMVTAGRFTIVGAGGPSFDAGSWSSSYASTGIFQAYRANRLTGASTNASNAGVKISFPNDKPLTPAAGEKLGGFEFTGVFGFSQFSSDHRIFVGFDSNSVYYTFDASGFTQNCFAFVKESGDSTIFLMQRSTSGTVYKLNTGISVSSGDLFEFSLWCPPCIATQPTMFASLHKVGTSAYWFGNDSASTNRPAANTFLTPQISASTGNASSVNTMEVQSVLIRGSY